MRRIKKPVFFIVVCLIAIFTALTTIGIKTQNGDFTKTYIKSLDDIRWGIDIRGGVDVTFSPPADYDASNIEIERTKSKIEERLIDLNITDYDVYADNSNDRIIVRFPWKSDEVNFDPESAVKELGETAFMTFREGYETDDEGLPTGVTADNVILVGEDIKMANVTLDRDTSEYQVALELTDDGAKKFSVATERLAQTKGVISIWMDEYCISYPQVNSHIADGHAVITGGSSGFSADEATQLANKINSGALPFKLETTGLNILSPTDGENAKDAMVLAGIIAFALIAVMMVVVYRVPGIVAVISLFGQVIATIAALTGFFGVFDSFTLTIPGIAGIILAIGIGVDANIITAERIKEELRKGKTLDGSIQIGFSKAFTAIFDGNITVVLVALILMGSFGPPSSFMATILKPLFFAFGPTTAGTIYSFGYTLIVGVILNFVFGVFCSRLMVSSLSKFKPFRKSELYGGISEGKEIKEHKDIDFIGKKKIFFTISSVILAITIIISFFGVKVDIEFKGGTMITYGYENEIDADEIDQVVSDVMGTDITVKKGENFSDKSTYFELSFSSNEGLTADKQSELTAALKENFPENNLTSLATNDVDATTGREFFEKCLVAVIFSFLILVIYIGFRFKKIGGLSAGVMGIVALLHDVFVVYATFVIFGISINSNFMAVILTILGYSINDTIVIYDRIRENEKSFGKNMQLDTLVNKSINQCLTRSIRTSVTTALAMLVVTIVAYLNGVNSIISFSFPLIIGMISGAYSSICIASTLWVLWQDRKARKHVNDYAKPKKKR